MEGLKSSYKILFFDLDHTLWDYDTNSREALEELFNMHVAPRYEARLNKFLRTFHTVNSSLWDRYNKGEVDREEIRNSRFRDILGHLEIDDQALSTTLSQEYITLCPTKPNVFPYTHEVLNHLKQHYQLAILTNGFKDVQEIKLEKSGLNSYFNWLITSDCSGYRKPASGIFTYALGQVDATADECLMIGDNLRADIDGATEAKMDSIYFNPKKVNHNRKIPFEINCLSELLNLL